MRKPPAARDRRRLCSRPGGRSVRLRQETWSRTRGLGMPAEEDGNVNVGEVGEGDGRARDFETP